MRCPISLSKSRRCITSSSRATRRTSATSSRPQERSKGPSPRSVDLRARSSVRSTTASTSSNEAHDARMKLAANLQDFWKNPIGRCASGNRFLFFCVKPTLWGYTLWGDVDAAVVRDMVAMVASELEHDVPLHGSFIDLRGVTLVDPSAYPALVDFIAAHGARLTAL